MFLIFCVAMVFSCKSDSLKGTKWKVIDVGLDSNNLYSEKDRIELLHFDPSRGLYSEYGDSILITYLSGEGVTTKYRQEGNVIIFYSSGLENDTTMILRHSRDTLFIRTNKGALLKNGQG